MITPGKEPTGMLALGCVLRVGQFLIFTVNNHADPLALILYFVSLDTYFGIRTHPLYFWPKVEKPYR
jgi:hypothetical protein